MKRYIRTTEQELPIQGYVGIWRLYDNKISDVVKVPITEGFSTGGYIYYPNEVNDSGRVVYDIRSQVFEIICSQEITKNKNAIKLIAEEFEISNQRYDVIPS